MKKRGQITIFIILGIIILISISLFFYYKSAVSPELEKIDEEINPIKNYIDTCIELTGREALTTLGLNGGFIKFPVEIEAKPFSYLATSPVRELKNPYWWYNGINNTPTIEFMQKQISEYITKELKSCIKDFEGFKNEFEINEGNLITITSINEEDVSFEITYPLNILSKSTGTKTKLTKFKINLPIRLKKIYELANAIMGSQFRDAFIEKKVIDLISLDNEIPTTDMEVNCKKKEWYIESTPQREGIKDRLKRLLSINLPYIRVANTNYDTNIFVPLPDETKKETYENSYYNYHYVWYATDKEYEDMHVGFTYDPKWSMELRAFPSDGKKLISNSQKGTELLSTVCLHIWHFTYDISFPVKVTVYDEKTSKHDEFTFIFAFKTSINHNKPDRISLASSTFNIPETINSEEFCSDTKHLSTIIAEDSIDKNTIDNVNLKFICGSFECPLGEIEKNFESGGEAFMSKKLPYCLAGYLRAERDSYLNTEIPAQTDREREFTISMTPISTITNYKVAKHSFDGKLISQAKELSPEEKVSITINNKDTNYETFGVYPSNEFPLKLLAKNNYKYHLSAYLLRGEDILGGYVGEWDVDWNLLKNANEVVFHVLEQEPLPKDMNERFLFIGALETYSKNLQGAEIK